MVERLKQLMRVSGTENSRLRFYATEIHKQVIIFNIVKQWV